jgi:NAD(P)-dependent dehydrogenase (short-subunit alcohol dehydrogenase family)
MAILTAAASGIGRATALHVAGEGARVTAGMVVRMFLLQLQ